VEITENCEEFAASQKTNFLYFKKEFSGAGTFGLGGVATG